MNPVRHLLPPLFSHGQGQTCARKRAPELGIVALLVSWRWRPREDGETGVVLGGRPVATSFARLQADLKVMLAVALR